MSVATPTAWSAAFGSPEFVDCQRWVVDSNSTLPSVVSGPAVISSVGATALLYPEHTATFDRDGNLAISLEGKQRS